MKTPNRLGITLTALALVCLLGAVSAEARVQVGESFAVNIDSARNYEGSPDGVSSLGWEYEIQQPGATYIAVHFSDFQLAEGDYLVISDARGDQSYTLRGRGKMGAGEFWARHVKGDSVVMRLYTASKEGAQGFVIDEFAAGYEEIGYSPEAICGVDDKENAVCYENSYATEYLRSKAVARMLISGTYLCTGWLVSSDNHLLTNEHCVTSSTEALNTDFEFMAEAPSCGSTNCQLCYPGDTISGATFVQDDAGLDYALLRFDSDDPAASYGYLQIDDRQAVVGEQIYIPQHPAGRAKELAIESTAASDGGLCKVTTITAAPCSGSGYNDVGYYCDTEGGSSGSPVLARSSHKVIALHHCALCPNRGVPIHLVWDQVSGLIGPQCTVDPDCDDGQFCNGAESCDAGSCQDGTAPCSGGDVCDEDLDLCVPPVCDNDGTCEAGEDCNNCSSDCISGSSGAVCGNNVCETGSGEDCLNCPSDCNGLTGGKPSLRYCCGDSVGCADARCTGDGNTCSTTGAGGSYCCGDGTCEGAEDSFNCAVDCGTAPQCGDGSCQSSAGEDRCTCPADCGAPASSELPNQTCTDGDDNDCDGLADCADGNCASDPACSCLARGETCSTDGECCSNRCHRGACK